MPRRIVEIGRNTLGGKKLLFILGPCVIESPAFTRRMGRKLKTICDGLGAQFVFKASYDKANRTSVNSFRGSATEIKRPPARRLRRPVLRAGSSRLALIRFLL